MERLSKDEALLITLMHHDGEGKPLNRAASELGMKTEKARRLLVSTKDKCPSLFPVLTDRQARILHLFTVDSMSSGEIATVMGIRGNTVKTHIRRLRNKGFLRDGCNLSRCESFDEATMSEEVRERW